MLIKSRIQSRVAIAAAVSLLALAGCNKANDSNKGAAAATVNGTAIAESSVELLQKQRGAQGQPVSPEARKEIIDHLVLQYLISQEAIKKAWTKHPKFNNSWN